ncbi:MAG: hypothetical protein ACKPKO_52845, partial [Candidatus Fonsibacter sp.]
MMTARRPSGLSTTTRNIYIRRKSNTRVEPNIEGSTGSNQRTTNQRTTTTDQNRLLMNSATIISQLTL